jgi:hypothetical protein
LFGAIEQVRDKVTRWLSMHNRECPSRVLGGIAPMQKLVLAA